MKVVNLGDPLNHRLTLRLTDNQFEYLTKISSILGTTPSDYLRMAINASMVSTSKAVEDMANGNVGVIINTKGMVGMSNENIKTDINDII